MFKASLLLFFVVLMTSNSQAYNLDDWPCVQRYIPELSANVVWQQQPNKQNPQLSEPVAQQNIVSLSTDLRTDIVLFENTINDYLDQNKEVIGLRNLLFYDIFESIQSKRSRILKGIFRYSAKQQKLAIRIDQQRVAISAALKSDKLDPAMLEDLQARQAWDSRAFRERREQLVHLCEKPVKLEQRLFFIAQALGAKTP